MGRRHSTGCVCTRARTSALHAGAPKHENSKSVRRKLSELVFRSPTTRARTSASVTMRWVMERTVAVFFKSEK
eukprot:218305-Pleurochrysis_carterae.AAC.2